MRLFLTIIIILFSIKVFAESNIDSSQIYINLATEYSQKSKFIQAERLLLKAQNFAKTDKNLAQEALVLNTLGNVYMADSKFPKAKEAFTHSIKINKELKNDSAVAGIYLNLSNLYYYSSDYDKVLEYLHLSLQKAKQCNFASLIVMINGNIGITYNKIGQYDKAIEYLKLTIKYFSENNDISRMSKGLTNIGIAYKNKQEPDSALFYFNKSLNYIRNYDDSIHLGLLYNNIGDTYIIIGNYKQAIENLNKSIEVNLKYSNNSIKANTFYLLGNVYAKTSPTKSLKYYLLSNKIATKYNLYEFVIKTYKKLYEYYKNTKEFEKSLVYYEKYKFLNDSLLGADSKLRIEELETKFDVQKKDDKIKLLQKEQEIQKITLQQSRNEKMLIALISGLLLLVVIMILLRFRYKQKNKLIQLEKQNFQVETKLLRSQMNPHFIYNSLNSIQSFISNNNSIDAERYLSKFARLMRLILENSRKQFVPINAEINTLNLYLQLEKLRFNNKFDYYINVANDIDKESFNIPPMLAQPYIENAILHGIMNNPKRGEININLTKHQNIIICEIDDNGIGRRASQLLKKSNNKTHNSLGIKLTEERIVFLNKKLKRDINIKIIDKFDENNISLGTTVIIKMPYISEY